MSNGLGLDLSVLVIPTRVYTYGPQQLGKMDKKAGKQTNS